MNTTRHSLWSRGSMDRGSECCKTRSLILWELGYVVGGSCDVRVLLVRRGTSLTVLASHRVQHQSQQKFQQTIQGDPVGLAMRKDQKDCDSALVRLSSCRLSFVICHCHCHDQGVLSRWCTRGMNIRKASPFRILASCKDQPTFQIQLHFQLN